MKTNEIIDKIKKCIEIAYNCDFNMFSMDINEYFENQNEFDNFDDFANYIINEIDDDVISIHYDDDGEITIYL